MTGRYSYIQGNGERAPDGLESQLRPDDIIFPEYLRAAGYISRQAGKGHVGTKKYLDAFGENDQPWDRWSPPVFDDDEFLAYQRELGVKPQRYSPEIVFKLQDRTSPGNSAGGWVVQQDGRPFPIEAQTATFSRSERRTSSRTRFVPAWRQSTRSTSNWTSSTLTSRSQSRLDLKNGSGNCAESSLCRIRTRRHRDATSSGRRMNRRSWTSIASIGASTIHRFYSTTESLTRYKSKSWTGPSGCF